MPLKWLNQGIFCSLAPLSLLSGCLKMSTIAESSLTRLFPMNNKNIYMVGIGGVGMSALAQFYAAQGARVSGSDRASSPTTDMLSKKGIQVCLQQKTEQDPPAADLLVYSDAVPAENPERARGKELGIPEHSYFEALGKAVEGKRVVAVSGTHGKTTTTAMLGKILIDAGFDPTVIVGS